MIFCIRSFDFFLTNRSTNDYRMEDRRDGGQKKLLTTVRSLSSFEDLGERDPVFFRKSFCALEFDSGLFHIAVVSSFLVKNSPIVFPISV